MLILTEINLEHYDLILYNLSSAYHKGPQKVSKLCTYYLFLKGNMTIKLDVPKVLIFLACNFVFSYDKNV